MTDLEGSTVVAYLSSDGFAELGSQLGLENRDSGLTAEITRADGFGVWLSPAGEHWARIMGVPWRYFRAFELEFEPELKVLPDIKRRIGFQG